ncbi:hypothetical protein TVAG_226850 [Trichomonas vaginalis G3]|uniref:Uncharacterized protein n=1 Tax=Trichomonas vaginalis (strain ATCC PRA-98 / G3) TaxID=412133 RepID=A2FCC9_TRIV3|nr:MYB-binding protein 1A family member family [Trichomonas vaginalis G3]EAX97441.1 hypothetical protein TVAG_226850 [Trichomonas vaginalis G3]KAI5551999.1 MYB-binding protein 1A family member family [Trichomonas vaginalis G3]|eukprot:XP_001310371.1 hypothetical protein [Trichomonas vaginalis G3]
MTDTPEDPPADNIFANISSTDLQNLNMCITVKCAELADPNAKVLEVMSPIFRGLASHKPTKRSGYAIILTVVLRKFHDRINEEEALKFIQNLNFNKKSKKSAARTSSLAKVTALLALVRAKIFVSETAASYALVECCKIAQERPMLQAFIYSALATMTIETEFRFFEETISSIAKNLDSFIFWFKIMPHIPEDKMSLVPEELRKGLYTDECAEAITKQLRLTKQPWNSQIWKVICIEGSDEQLLTFWQGIVMKEIRGAPDAVRISTILIVKSVLPILRPSLYPIVICASFIRLINSFLGSPLCAHAVEFLDHVIKDHHLKLEDIMKHFFFIQAHLPDGFNFHRQVYDMCTIEELKTRFELLKEENENHKIEFKQRIPADKKSHDDSGYKMFRFDKLRALFIATAHHKDIKFTTTVFDYLFQNWENQRQHLASDLVIYDEHRVEGSATLPDILKQPKMPHFDSCYKLYSICTGASSSPSLDTVIPPALNDSAPSSALIQVALQHSKEPSLIQHAYKCHLKSVAGKIPTDDLEKFLKDYVPAADTFTIDSVSILQVAVDSCEISFNIAGPLFDLFCNTLKNCEATVAMPLGNLIIETLKRESKDFSLQTVLSAIFKSMDNLPNSIVSRHEKLIQPVFSQILAGVIKAKLPLSPKCVRALEKQLNEAVLDYAVKSTPHFCITIFQEYTKLPGTVPYSLFGPICCNLPTAKRLQRRVDLMNLVTAILATPKGPDVLITYEKDFTNCVNALLEEVKRGSTDENGKHKKEAEKRHEKVLLGIKKWFELIKNRRKACEHVAIGDFRRKCQAIMQIGENSTKSLLTLLQNIEQQVHVKHRNFE